MAHTLPTYFPETDTVHPFDPSLLPHGVAELLRLAGFCVEYETHSHTAMWVITSKALGRGLGVTATALKTYGQWQRALEVVLENPEDA